MNAPLSPHEAPAPPEIELCMLRHGESRWNVENPHIIGGRSNETPLTPKGEEQARLLGRYLLREKIIPTRVYASPAVRTIATAEIALAEMGLNPAIVTDDALQEMDQGEWVGLVRAEMYTEAVLAEVARLGKDFKVPGGESMNEVGLRKFGWLTGAFKELSQPERVFVFGHGVATRCLAAHIQKWTHKETVSAHLDNASISLFTYHAGKWALEDFGRMPE